MQSPNELMQILLKYKDVESAIALYKEIAGYVVSYKEVQKAARATIGLHLTELGEREVKTNAGKAAYTVPKTPKLDKKLWREAMSRDPVLRQAQHTFDDAQNTLNVAQDPFKVMPEGSLRIT